MLEGVKLGLPKAGLVGEADPFLRPLGWLPYGERVGIELKHLRQQILSRHPGMRLNPVITPSQPTLVPQSRNDSITCQDFARAWIGQTEWSRFYAELWGLCRREPEEAWAIIEAIYKERPTTEVLDRLAAGPLEDLLSENGELVIERVENLAHCDPQFIRVLRSVRQRGMPPLIWDRVQAIISNSMLANPQRHQYPTLPSRIVLDRAQVEFNLAINPAT